MSALQYVDGKIELKKVTFGRYGENPEVSLTETIGGGCLLRVGEAQAVVKAQDLLSAALFVGAKHIDVKLQ